MLRALSKARTSRPTAVSYQKCIGDFAGKAPPQEEAIYEQQNKLMTTDIQPTIELRPAVPDVIQGVTDIDKHIAAQPCKISNLVN